ncbi:hypothetical protein SDC9_106482 [bioreactor metagenome]|uniref:Uncharacterized protein n=1 Tax=bioreactor metagenome TaxID=1076179 RepID=A0A645B3I4_9ZZZZ
MNLVWETAELSMGNGKEKQCAGFHSLGYGSVVFIKFRFVKSNAFS